jgi:diguanylate cyclase (GGDEF)-like protein/putative nucleotidyltransferase with HDIG domain
MFAVFLAAKKTPEIRAFLLMMVDCVVWIAGSILMRLQVWPGLNFWYYVSLLAIFSMEFVFYNFLHSFARENGKFMLTVFLTATFALVPGTLTGFFLAPPVPSVQPDGTVFYVYHTVYWHMIFPCVLFITVIIASLQLLGRMKREQGVHSSGALILFLGGVIELVGNLMQIFIPGNTFPFDALAGVIYAGMMVFALYRRRLFRMTLVVSRGILMLAVVAVCFLLGIFCVDPFLKFFQVRIGLGYQASLTVVSLLLAGMLSLTYSLVRRVIDTLFTREEQQNKLLKSFSAEVSQSLSTDDIMAKVSGVIQQELPVVQLYICLADEKGYTARYSSRPLAPMAFSISKDSPKVHYLEEQEPYLIMREFCATPHAISDWAEEKELFRRLEIDCVGAMRDGRQIVGLVLLSARDHGRTFSSAEMGFLETVCSVASIAMKNASLYEQMFREARIDALTGAYNYRYFVEKEEELFKACYSDCITLMFVDVDDLKLYNQLYGVEAGNDALRCISDELTLCAGESGTVFRTSGKVFAVLLPHWDAHRANVLAEEIQRRVRTINSTAGRQKYKPLTVSVGICAAPYAASSAKELMNNADLAAFNAKKSGKDQIMLFRGASAIPQKLAERTDAIVDNVDRGSDEYGAMPMISALTAAIDAKDHYTFAHSKNVARYAANLAVAAGLNNDQVRTIYAAGLLHDIGKISIPEDILNKSGKLTDTEYGLMKNHVNNSIEMIRHLPEMDYLIPAVLGHHERWDGKGYPRGIAGEDIPISGRCLAIADVFDAMTTDRPYRKGLPLEYALMQISQGAGTQFDPQLATVFIHLVQGNEMPLAGRLAGGHA